VYGLDDDVASRWGPRVVQLVQAAAKAVKAVPAS
jgi:iron complex transport system substrate-binding protein